MLLAATGMMSVGDPKESAQGVRAVKRKQWAVVVGVVVGCGWVPVGCNSPLIRTQSPEVEQAAAPEVDSWADEESPQLVGDVTRTFGLHLLKVEGVALVNNLRGTGSDPPPSPLRDILLSEIRAHNVAGASQLIASKDNALVTVTAYLPPGVRKGDHVDAIVKAPVGTKTKSLEGGYLLPVRLQEMRLIQNRIRTGSVTADATGPIVVDAVFDGAEDKVHLLRGRVLGGVRSRITRPIHLVLKEEYRSGRYSARIGRAINARFHYYDRGVKKGVAKPINDKLIELQVPLHYQPNVRRFVQVVRRVAIAETPADRAARIEMLGRKLLDPTTAASAAAELEAIGEEGAVKLLTALKSDDPEVRFYAAEAAAYLDYEEAAEVLAEAAETEPAFRWHALAALTAMRQVAAAEALSSLLHSTSAETRYGAFRALRKRNSRDPLVQPDAMFGEVEYHAIPSDGPPMVHFSRSMHQEIVLFGSDMPLRPPAVLFAGRRILLKGTPDGRIKVTRFSVDEEGDTHVVCPPRLDAVLRTVGELGATYGEMLQMVQQAKRNGDLEARVVVHALAEPGRPYYRDKKGAVESASAARKEQGDRTPPAADVAELESDPQSFPLDDTSPSDLASAASSRSGANRFWSRFRLWGNDE